MLDRMLQAVGFQTSVPPLAAIGLVLLLVRVGLQFVLNALRAQAADDAPLPGGGGAPATQPGATQPGAGPCLVLACTFFLEVFLVPSAAPV